MKYQPGDLVKHALTGETFIVLKQHPLNGGVTCRGGSYGFRTFTPQEIALCMEVKHGQKEEAPQ